MVMETKQVRVDNWGTYFLQRLQLFFSKTDYCDLTLQFEGNVQLKVHRLVMNACTEYFLFLEQTCAAPEENTILMPKNMQADVIVPIVNFMYTGMLEFHPSVYHKLYKAAETMSISVLQKLLEAQMESSFKKDVINLGKKRNVGGRPASKKDIIDPPIASMFDEDPLAADPPVISTRTPPVASYKKTSPPKSSPLASTSQDCDGPVPVSMALSGRARTNYRRRHNISVSGTTSLPHSTPVGHAEVKWQPVSLKEEKPVTRVLHDSTPRPTRFEWPEDDLPSSNFMDSTFDESISLTSRPLVTKREEEEFYGPDSSTYSKSDRTSQNSFSTDTLDDYESYTRSSYPISDHVRVEKPNTAEHNEQKRKLDSVVKMVSPKRARLSEKENEEKPSTTEHTISIKAPKGSGELDHTKIVQEILKKYPQLVKKNKNIKLKIMTKPDEVSGMVNHKIKMQVSNSPEPPAENERSKMDATRLESEPVQDPLAIETVVSKTKTTRVGPDGPWTCLGCDDKPEFVLYYLFRKHLTDVHHESFDSSCCKYCDRKCGSEITMAYHLHVKHNLKPPSKMNFPKCPKCAYIAITSENLKEHLSRHLPYHVQCPFCKLGFVDRTALNNHIILASHKNSKDTKLTCPYCMLMKKILSPSSLFNHIKETHMKEAQKDRITSLEDNMDFEEPEAEIFEGEEPDEEDMQQQTDKVKIISDVKVARTEEESQEECPPKASQVSNLEVAQSKNADLKSINNVTVPSTIANNLGSIDIVVLDENRQFILQQPAQECEAEDNTEFILPQDLNNEALLQAASSELNSTDELVMVLTDQDYHHHHQEGQTPGQSDNSNIVVLYSQPLEGQEGQFITTSQGNIMVNSETGMFEIPHGATAIATSDGNIIVNQQIPVTESDTESIEMIQKEMQVQTNINSDNKKLDAKQKDVTNQVDSDQNKSNGDNQIDSKNIDSKGINNGKTNEQNAKVQTKGDLTDGAVQGAEPMEVDEDAHLETIQEENNEEKSTQSQNEILEPQQEKSTNVQGSEVSATDEKLNSSAEENLNSSVEENLILNDPSGFYHEPTQETVSRRENVKELSIVEQNQQELTEVQGEAMEVDGGTCKDSVDEVDCSQDNVGECQVSTQQTDTSTTMAPDLVTTNDADSSVELQDTSVSSIKDKEEECTTTPLSSKQDEEDSDSSQRIKTRELNKSILEDWSEDTDSQNSVEKQDISIESTNTETNSKEASNVSKLMDDWEEEEEGN